MPPRAAVALLVAAAVAVACGCGGGGPKPTTAGPRADAPGLRFRASCPAVPGFRCATIRVPLDRRGDGGGRTLTLDVAVQRGVPTPRGYLALLSGGPGQPGLPFGPRMARRLKAAIGDRRLVVVDQRGTGRNALRCPELQAAVGTSDLAVPPRAAVAACGRRLGTARAAYATADTVADLDAIRRVLGARSWTIGGISYGAFVAQRYALAHPGATRAVVLDSVVPQEGVELLERVPLRATARVLRAVGGAAAVADLRAVLAARPDLGPPLFDALTARTIGVPRLDDVPGVLRGAAAGDLGPLLALLRAGAREQRGAPVAVYSTGLHAATLCADAPALWRGGPAAPRATRDATLRRLRTTLAPSATAPWPAATALDQGLLATCRAWPPTAAPPAPAASATIRAPTLLLAGDRDLSTPLEWARAQARRIPDARVVVVPGAGHSVLSREPGTAGRDALAAFLRGR